MVLLTALERGRVSFSFSEQARKGDTVAAATRELPSSRKFRRVFFLLSRTFITSSPGVDMVYCNPGERKLQGFRKDPFPIFST
jgi:hypothetical protein